MLRLAVSGRHALISGLFTTNSAHALAAVTRAHFPPGDGACAVMPARAFWFSSTLAPHSTDNGNRTILSRLAKAGDSGDLGAVLKVIETAGDQFDVAGVETALTQVERCTQGMTSEELEQLHSNTTFQMLADMAVSIAGQSSPEVLAHTIAVMGRLQFADQLVLDELSRSLMSHVNKLEPHHLQQVVQGLKMADHSPGVLLLDAIYERLQGLGGEVHQEQADSIKADLKSLGHDESHPSNPEPQRQTDRIKYT